MSKCYPMDRQIFTRNRTRSKVHFFHTTLTTECTNAIEPRNPHHGNNPSALHLPFKQINPSTYKQSSLLISMRPLCLQLHDGNIQNYGIDFFSPNSGYDMLSKNAVILQKAVHEHDLTRMLISSTLTNTTI